RSHYKLPAPQVEQENCVAHNGSIIPVPGRDIFVQAWYQGGISIIDFTDSSKPVEIAYFDRGPIDAKHLTLGGYWSVYWYQGHIYGTEIYRGLDVFKLLPSEFLSANEIAAAELANQGALFNPQQQFRVHWPAEPVVALAYLDQLQRDQVVPELMAKRLVASLEQVQSGKKDPDLAVQLKSLANDLAGNSSEALAVSRLESLSAILQRIAEGLE
ncbi:MAG TPA: hypothetical protein VJN01_16530, partial [Xanthomonadales bacterium]|nr:hypothetical protein [Xanthomonadales bacterium]